MPGFIGTYDYTQVDLKGDLKRMLNKTHLVKGYKIKQFHWPGLSVAVVYRPEDPPWEISVEDKVVLIEGKIYKQKTFDINNIQDLNGNFFGFYYNKKNHNLKLFNDRFGLHPHFIRINKRVRFAYQIWPLILGGEKLDLTTILEVVKFEVPFNNRTYFQEINFIPPAAIVNIQDGRVEIHHYWKLNFRYRGVSIDDIHDIFKKAVAIRKKPNAGILLSGGLDSRLILMMANDLTAFTFGPDNCTDVRIVKELQRRFKLEVNFLDLHPDQLPEYAEEALLLTSGLCPIHNLIRLEHLSRIGSITKRVFSGFAGNAILGGTTPMLFLPKSLACRWLNRKLRLVEFAESFESKIVDEHNERIMNYIKSDDMRYALMEFYFKELIASQFSLGISLDRNFHEVLIPFVDYQVVDATCGLRVEEKILSVGYARLFNEYFPEFAKIPGARTGYPASTSILKSVFIGLRRRYLPKTKHYIDFNYWFSVELKDWIEKKLFRKGGFWVETVGKQRVLQMMKNTLYASNMLTIEMAMELT